MKLTILLLLTISIILITSTLTLGQPPIPAAPSQAPIDGGLGLLAAVGGAYAWKKLRNNSDSA